ncbi:MAG: hypothetical protein HZB09_01175 [Candidatus Yonathbacteria bacterium]|nr:hypothetical protein [Candidatus Yonathbacteria bacterium]
MQKKTTLNLTEGWKILFKYLGEYKKEITLLSLLGVFSAFANASVPFIVGKFLDSKLTSSACCERTMRYYTRYGRPPLQIS